MVAGGDGTVRDASSVLAGTGIPVGILPCGTGNLYASAVGVPRDLRAGHRRHPRREPRPARRRARCGSPGRTASTVLDSGFVVACGTGLDARLIAATSREARRRYGVAAYFLAASRLLGNLAPQPTRLEVDGVGTDLESVVVLVANCGEAIPGRLRPRLPIRADDGLFHVFVLPRGGILGSMRGALELMAADAAGSSSSGSGVRLTRDARPRGGHAARAHPGRRRRLRPGLARGHAPAGRPHGDPPVTAPPAPVAACRTRQARRDRQRGRYRR